MEKINSQYSLNSLENYKKVIDDGASDIVNKYYSLIMEYLSFILENIAFKNTTHTKFIIERGIETITHVFTTLLYFSRNLDMSYFHSQKSFYFYVEYIGQITDDKHSFLQLNSRDASLFVYKKTIFEINNEVRKNSTTLSQNDVEKLDVLNSSITVLKNICSVLIDRDYKMVKNVSVVCNEIMKNSVNKLFFQIIEAFVNSLMKESAPEKYLELVQLFIRRYSKLKPELQYNITTLKIINKFTDPECDKKLNEPSVIFIRWIFC
jgi:hypothetical protein